MVKRKLPANPTAQETECQTAESTSTAEFVCDDKEEKRPVFRNPNFEHNLNSSGKKKTWRSLKQIIAHDRILPWSPDAVHYSSLTAPPSRIPPKKLADISGLIAKYRDPETKLLYATSDEFSTIRSLPSDIIAGYLTLRGANNPIP